MEVVKSVKKNCMYLGVLLGIFQGKKDSNLINFNRKNVRQDEYGHYTDCIYILQGGDLILRSPKT